MDRPNDTDHWIVGCDGGYMKLGIMLVIGIINQICQLLNFIK